MRRRGILAAPLAALVLGAVPASADATSYAYTGSDLRGGYSYAGFLGSPASDDLTIAASGKAILFTDPTGVRPGGGCKSLSETEVTCSTFAGFFYVRGYGGNDTIVVQPTTPVSLYANGGNGDDVIQFDGPRGYAAGQDGDDTITGDRGRQVFYGGNGDDLLTTGRGRDYLNGGLGIDSFDAGDGNDLIHAEDKTTDASILCGTGSDLAIVSKGERRPPKACERYGVGHTGGKPGPDEPDEER